MENKNEKSYVKGGTYGKRPLWQWIVTYLVIGVLVYGLVYYVFVGRKGGSYSIGSQSNPSAQQMPTYRYVP